jgi:CubicO group peptidase (beta-lactamase class C family)
MQDFHPRALAPTPFADACTSCASPARRRTLGALAATGLALLGGCAARGYEDPLPDDPRATAQMLATRLRLCRLAFVVVRGRQVRRVDAVSGCGEVATPGDVFQAASLGKPVFAWAVLQLAAQGVLDLDAPVLHYLPGGYEHTSNPFVRGAGHRDRVDDPRLARVTVRMLLQHTAGLPNLPRAPLVFAGEPGAAWRYSGEGYTLLQRAVEAVVGAPLDRVMAARVFGPLGMAASGYPPDLQPVAGHHEDGRPLPPPRFDAPVAGTTLLTTAGDYGRFLAALLNDEHTLRTIQSSPVPVPDAPGLAWGLGWGLANAGPRPLLWHWGSNPGFRAFVMAAPDTGDAIALFTDSDGGMGAAHDLVRTVLPAPREVFGFRMLRG